jgi:drug/metabolite transporter (DMT)-like permease
MLLGLAGLLLGYVATWYRALKNLPATITAAVLVGATVITSLLQSVLVTKTVSLELAAQSALVVTGIYVVLMAGMDLWQKVENKRGLRTA